MIDGTPPFKLTYYILISHITNRVVQLSIPQAKYDDDKKMREFFLEAAALRFYGLPLL